MPLVLLIGVCSGLISALLFYSAARGGAMLSTLLLLLTPLPALLAGLGWGWISATAGAVAGAVVIAVATSVPFAAGYALALGVPAVIITYLAHLSRPDSQDEAAREWYPIGRVVAGMALYAGSLPLLLLPLIGGSYEVLRARMAEFYRRLSTRAAPDLGLNPLNEEQIAGLTELTIAALPGALAAYWFGIFVLNLYLAGRIARASGWLERDWPDLPAMTYPVAFPLLAAVAVAATFMPGLPGVAGSSFSGGLLFAYLLGGLALVHFIARVRARWLIWLAYGGLLVFGPYAAFALMLGGLLDPLLGLRHRFGASTPPT